MVAYKSTQYTARSADPIPEIIKTPRKSLQFAFPRDPNYGYNISNEINNVVCIVRELITLLVSGKPGSKLLRVIDLY